MARAIAVAAVTTLSVLLGCRSSAPEPERREVSIPSSIDGAQQKAFVILPPGFDPEGEARPLLTSLHTWSSNYQQRHEELERLAAERGWIYLFPDFRGQNDHPEACGSELAQQDILDAVAWAKREFPIDESRIYLTGTSGGGHMTLLMAARHPEPWAAASAWVPISDLAAWQETHAGERYGEMLRACTGGEPGASPEVDQQYSQRSPLGWMAGAKGVPLDIAAGIRDGHEGSVPIRHTLEAFNALATAIGAAPVSEAEIAELSASPTARLAEPQPSDQEQDAALGREIVLRRTAGPHRGTIFEGGHEGIASAQVEWLAKHVKE